MNKIFKVLWNRSRSTNVVTDETRTAHGKGRQGVTAVRATAPSGFAVGLAAALAAMGLGLSSPLWAASTIKPGWDATKVTSNANGTVHNVTTEAIKDKVGINKFDNFQVVANEIANLKFHNQAGNLTADKLLNFVDDTITIDGTVNAIRNGKVRGDLYFISHKGMVVGSTGVINAGSLTVAVPTEERFDEWVTAAETGSTTHDPYSVNFAQALEEGAYPINPEGVITVAGSINAGNRVALSAAQIEVKSGARIETGVSDFADMVNITDESGSITADAGLGEADLSFVQDPDSGDILLVVRADGDDSSLRFPWEEGVAFGNVTLKEVARTASITVEKDAVVKATGDITAEASASNTSYDVERGSFFPEPEKEDVNP